MIFSLASIFFTFFKPLISYMGLLFLDDFFSHFSQKYELPQSSLILSMFPGLQIYFLHSPLPWHRILLGYLVSSHSNPTQSSLRKKCDFPITVLGCLGNICMWLGPWAQLELGTSFPFGRPLVQTTLSGTASLFLCSVDQFCQLIHPSGETGHQQRPDSNFYPIRESELQELNSDPRFPLMHSDQPAWVKTHCWTKELQPQNRVTVCYSDCSYSSHLNGVGAGEGGRWTVPIKEAMESPRKGGDIGRDKTTHVYFTPFLLSRQIASS